MKDIEMLTKALVLAVTAPDKKRSKDATRLAICLASNMPPDQVKQSKDQAQLILQGVI